MRLSSGGRPYSTLINCYGLSSLIAESISEHPGLKRLLGSASSPPRRRAQQQKLDPIFPFPRPPSLARKSSAARFERQIYIGMRGVAFFLKTCYSFMKQHYTQQLYIAAEYIQDSDMSAPGGLALLR